MRLFRYISIAGVASTYIAAAEALAVAETPAVSL